MEWFTGTLNMSPLGSAVELNTDFMAILKIAPLWEGRSLLICHRFSDWLDFFIKSPTFHQASSFLDLDFLLNFVNLRYKKCRKKTFEMTIPSLDWFTWKKSRDTSIYLTVKTHGFRFRLSLQTTSMTPRFQDPSLLSALVTGKRFHLRFGWDPCASWWIPTGPFLHQASPPWDHMRRHGRHGSKVETWRWKRGFSTWEKRLERWW